MSTAATSHPDEAPHVPPRTALLAIGGIGLGVVLVLALVFVRLIPAPLVVPPIHGPFGGEAADVTTAQVVLVEALNVALAEQDREAFFSHIAGDAVAPLEIWWDNMDALGWTGGAISPTLGSIQPIDEGDSAISTFILGASLRFTSFSPRGSGHADAGKTLVQGVLYEGEVRVDAGVATITSWAPVDGANPWDSEGLVVAVGDHVAVAGTPDEQALVESTLSTLDEAAAWVVDDAGDSVPLDGFTVFVTADPGRFGTWLGEHPWQFDAAGFARPTLRPDYTEGLSPLIAQGGQTSTSFVVLGPVALERLYSVAVHEFAHVVHYTAAPSDGFFSPPVATIEGWARYQQSRGDNGGAFAPSGSDDARQVSYCVDGFLPPGSSLPTDEQLYGPDAGCYYWLSATMFAFLADRGLDVADIAAAAKETTMDPLSTASLSGEPVGVEEWVTWTRSRY